MGTNYYVQTPPCEHACDHCSQARTIHLGKSSAGWKFLHRTDDDWLPADAHQKWLERASAGPITDEYGQDHTLEDLLAFIRAKAASAPHDLEPGYGYFGDDRGREFSSAEFF